MNSLLILLTLFAQAATQGPVPEDFGAGHCFVVEQNAALRTDMDRSLSQGDFGPGTRQVEDLIAQLHVAHPGQDLCQSPAALTMLSNEANMMARYAALVDSKIFNAPDYWQTPAEMLTHKPQLGRYGDCEDFALLKYWILRRMGCSEDKMYIVVLRDKPDSWHAVLTVHIPGKGSIVLDNFRGSNGRWMTETIYPSLGRPAYLLNERKVRWLCL